MTAHAQVAAYIGLARWHLTASMHCGHVTPAGLALHVQVAAYVGAVVMRRASAQAFAAEERAMLAGDIITRLPAALKAVFPASALSHAQPLQP